MSKRSKKIKSVYLVAIDRWHSNEYEDGCEHDAYSHMPDHVVLKKSKAIELAVEDFFKMLEDDSYEDYQIPTKKEVIDSLNDCGEFTFDEDFDNYIYHVVVEKIKLIRKK